MFFFVEEYAGVIETAVDAFRRATCLEFQRLDVDHRSSWPVDYLHFNDSVQVKWTSITDSSSTGGRGLGRFVDVPRCARIEDIVNFGE